MLIPVRSPYDLAANGAAFVLGLLSYPGIWAAAALIAAAILWS